MLNELQHLRPLNAGDRNRTGTVSLQQDFKSCASASSATPAYMIMGRGGFEPPKQVAADLQSVPFGHSGICPFKTFNTKLTHFNSQNKLRKADDRTRTDNLLITNQLLCQLSHIGISKWDLQGSNL